MPEKWLYLPIEVIARELDAKLLLTYYAVKHNYHVILAKQHKLYEIIESLPKGTFVSKGYPRNKKGPLFMAKKLGHAVVDLDEEGLIFNEKAYLHNRINENYFNILDQIYCWGNSQRDTLVKAYGHPEKIYLTGHPRFDLVKNKFRILYNDEVERIKKEFGDFILVNTRFGKYNHLKGFNPKHQFIMRLYEHFIEMVKELSQQYPNLNIVVRPHPREVFSSYEKEFINYKNVLVVREGNVVKWNLASKLVIHNGCTTGIETFLLDHPVISYMPITSDQHTDEYLANAVSVQAVNINELTSFIDSHLSGEDNRLKENQHINERKAILSNYYAAMDENNAYENIIRLLDSLRIKSDSSIQESLLQVSASSNEDETKNESEFTEKQIKTFFKNLDEIEKNEINMIIQKIDRNFFVIKPTR
jgi:surface carbohydrate biosynthesis protein